ncbi:LicD family protein [Enterocloster bolteae]|jgi:lipopolysaccharide cholinephosphotransferase|uniref:LicD family protein n=1 Tax=Enterocloster bolteae TaxID=208479 RepID=A0A412YTD6_9FIRM|nr:LicD family protein [Enterocloster bolteae]RGQ56232.1 LicD family protein [Enterocloster bolteae]RGS01894.1 LicD family protein [Enterocloster bolteae]RGV68713.1 LicD family protein [Enterocloster bolteae]
MKNLMVENTLSPLRKLQLTELSIFSEVQCIIENLNLRYFVSDGTFLGAIRHNGFIPWDDDIDISMPRTDYEIFIKTASQYLPSHLHMINFKHDSDCIDYMTKIVDDRYKILHKHPKKNRLMSVWIDIFPLDGMPNNLILRKIHGFRLLALRALFKYSLFDELVNINNNKRPWYENILIGVGKRISFEKYMNHRKRMFAIDTVLMKYEYDKCDRVVSFMGAYKLNSIMSKKVYGEGRLYTFEKLIVKGPEDYDTYLRTIYNDYIKLPSEDERNWHGSEIINI